MISEERQRQKDIYIHTHTYTPVRSQTIVSNWQGLRANVPLKVHKKPVKWGGKKRPWWLWVAFFAFQPVHMSLMGSQIFMWEWDWCPTGATEDLLGSFWSDSAGWSSSTWLWLVLYRLNCILYHVKQNKTLVEQQECLARNMLFQLCHKSVLVCPKNHIKKYL